MKNASSVIDAIVECIENIVNCRDLADYEIRTLIKGQEILKEHLKCIEEVERLEKENDELELEAMRYLGDFAETKRELTQLKECMDRVSDKIDKLRYKAAATGSGVISVSVEELNKLSIVNHIKGE